MEVQSSMYCASPGSASAFMAIRTMQKYSMDSILSSFSDSVVAIDRIKVHAWCSASPYLDRYRSTTKKEFTLSHFSPQFQTSLMLFSLFLTN